MNPIDIGKITISPFEFDSILEVQIVKELNEHSTLFACGVIKDDTKFEPVTNTEELVKIICANDEQVYFNGVLEDIKITRINAIYHLEIHAVSNTKLLDKVKHKRSFQDNTQSYESIVNSVIMDKSGSVKYNAAAKTVENIILQYNETDWEFAKRLASHTNDVLIPITADDPAFHFGTPDTGTASLSSNNYAISKDIDAYRRIDNNNDALTENDTMTYTVQTNAFLCEIGEMIRFNDIDLHVCRFLLTFINSALTVIYTLCPEKAISAAKIYNREVTGLTLDGKVLKVENDNVKLHLDIDEEQDEVSAHLFAYATGYSAQGHTGWYVMPENGDTVQLIFPEEDEKYAYATSSIRQEDTARTANPLVKYWRTPFGKEIRMDEKEVLISSMDDETYIRINMDTGIEIVTAQSIKIASNDKVNIDGGKDIRITAGGKLSA